MVARRRLDGRRYPMPEIGDLVHSGLAPGNASFGKSELQMGLVSRGNMQPVDMLYLSVVLATLA